MYLYIHNMHVYIYMYMYIYNMHVCNNRIYTQPTLSFRCVHMQILFTRHRIYHIGVCTCF